MAKQTIIGLDASTSTIGVGVLSYNSKSITLKHREFYKPPSNEIELFERLSQVKQYISGLISKYKPDQVALEDILLGKAKFTNIKTLTSLAIFNRVVGLTVYEALGKPPTLLNVLSIRHKLKKTKELPKKEDMPELVSEYLGIPFEYILNKKGKPIEENMDLADGIAVGIAQILIERGKK